MSIKFYRQRPVSGGRPPLPSCVLQEIWVGIDRLARKHKVSRSWVIATILAEALGIKEQIPYYKAEQLSKIPRNG